MKTNSLPQLFIIACVSIILIEMGEPISKYISPDKIWDEAVREVHEGGNQSYNSMGKIAVEKTVSKTFEFLYQEAQENNNVTVLDFLDEIEEKFY